MASPRVLILRAPGTNCDQETGFAFARAGGVPEYLHVNRLLEKPRLTADYQILCLPGGFSYGDDIAAGRILANQIRHHLAEVLAEFKAQGKLILGICNGFQILIRSGVLLPDTPAGVPATLTWNGIGRYQDRWVGLRTVGTKCVFLQGVETLYLPIAHAEGRFVARDAATLNELRQRGQLPLRYAELPDELTSERPEQGRAGEGGELDAMLPFPHNPNASQANVAGVCDESGRVFGLMPHPERHIDPTHHPRWTRLAPRDKGDGLVLFENAVRYFQ